MNIFVAFFFFFLSYLIVNTRRFDVIIQMLTYNPAVPLLKIHKTRKSTSFMRF